MKTQRENEIALNKDQLAYDNLKNVQRAEAELRKRRDASEADALQDAARTQATSVTWVESCAQEIRQ